LNEKGPHIEYERRDQKLGISDALTKTTKEMQTRHMVLGSRYILCTVYSERERSWELATFFSSFQGL